MNAGWYVLSEGPDGKREVAHDERFSSQAGCEAYIRRHHIPAAGLLTAELWDGSRWIGLRALTGGCLAVGEQEQGSDLSKPTRLSGSHITDRSGLGRADRIRHILADSYAIFGSVGWSPDAPLMDKITTWATEQLAVERDADLAVSESTEGAAQRSEPKTPSNTRPSTRPDAGDA